MSLKLCFLAPSTFGKSTAVDILKKKYNASNIKLAEPLYQLQDMFYSFLGKTIGDKQDGELLQFYGLKVRKENPRFLLDEFIKKLNKEQNAIVLNDDCRPYDYDVLKELGFLFIKIKSFPHVRDDHSPINKKEALEWQSEIPFDYEIENLGTLEEYENNLLTLIERINKKDEMLHSTSTKRMQL